MGAEPWIYFVPFEEDFQSALEKLKAQEFAAGRYFPVNDEFFESDFGGEVPESIADAREMADAEGTGSILDIDRVGDSADYCVVRRFTATDLESYFQSATPDEQLVKSSNTFYEDIGRGQGVCFPVYEGNKAVAICFAGYSFD
jgi:hypothetical protein